jgi:adenylate cyclase
MDRIWQWARDRYGARYSWLIYAVTYPLVLVVYVVFSSVVVTFEGSDRYLAGAEVTGVYALLLVYAMVLPGIGDLRVSEQWAAGLEVDQKRVGI